MNEAIRTFVAIKTDSQIAAALLEVQSRLKKRLAGIQIRWSSQEQLHITLAFLGNVMMNRVGELVNALGRACEGTSALNLTVTGIGAFPSIERPRVIWAGIGGEVEQLNALQRRVFLASGGFGDHSEEREFHPHLTLGRLSGRSRGDETAAAEVIRSIPSLALGGWRANSVFLMKSDLTPTGAVYTDIAEFPLIRV